MNPEQFITLFLPVVTIIAGLIIAWQLDGESRFRRDAILLATGASLISGIVHGCIATYGLFADSIYIYHYLAGAAYFLAFYGACKAAQFYEDDIGDEEAYKSP